MIERLAASLLLVAATLSVAASPSDKVVLDVKGMTCAACPVTVKTVLKKQPGVEEVKVDLQKHTAEIRFDSGKVSAEKLAQAVTEAGFPATAQK